jgi:hypothetical protein
MHRITISIEGAVSVSESREVADGDALPLFVKLKSDLVTDEPQPRKKRGRPPQAHSDSPEAPTAEQDTGSAS